MNKKHTTKVLDHGFVTLRNLAGPTRRISRGNVDNVFVDGARVTQMLTEDLRFFDADDTDVANAARMSFEGQDMERTYEIEMKLNRYLAKNKHMTPFESIEVWLEMKLPIFVARQFVRHRTATLNELSARYKELPGEFYIPAIQDVVLQTADKKQGGVLVDLDDEEQVLRALRFMGRLRDDCNRSYAHYEESVGDGIALEQSRLHLHVNHYTHWLWKQDLRNLFHFLALRDHSHAQREAQQYARAVIGLLQPHIPGLMALFDEVMR